MNERPHRKLNVWKSALDFVIKIYHITSHSFPKSETYGLSKQMQRAAVSIPSNIAEGAARKTKNEQKQFFYIARGSISELDTQLEIAFQLNYLDKNTFSELSEKLAEIGKMLEGLIKYKSNHYLLIMRFDLQIIASWIEEKSKVLDLGCGEGELMLYLKEKKSIDVTGIDLDEHDISECIARGLSVIQGDIMEEVLDYPDDTFDYVILSQTLQQVYNPDKLIQEILRIGKRGIVSFPSFSYWNVRIQLLFNGRAPVSKELPYQWYDTPNIRVIPLKDFRTFCDRFGFKIVKETAIASDPKAKDGKIVTFLPDWFAKYGIFMLEK